MNGNLPEINANRGLLALMNSDLSAAENYIAKASNAFGINEIMGNLHLAQGKYALAEQDFANQNTNSAALAQLLNKNYTSAGKTLQAVKNADAMTSYLKAIVCNRTGNKSEAANALAEALKKDPSLRSYADKDLELK